MSATDLCSFFFSLLSPNEVDFFLTLNDVVRCFVYLLFNFVHFSSMFLSIQFALDFITRERFPFINLAFGFVFF